MNQKNTTRVCVITCYRHSDYVRASTLRKATASLPGYEVTIVKNQQKGALRYAEVVLRVIAARVRNNPDIYLLTFRGYEMLLPIRLLTLGRPLVFDEFINLEEWLLENQRVREGGVLHKLIKYTYRMLVRLPDLIITDTPSHAKYSAKLSNLSESKIKAVPVAADEDIFKPSVNSMPMSRDGGIQVFYYGGNMLPLHGLSYVLKSSIELMEDKIEFTIIGGDSGTADLVRTYQKRGAKIKYKRRVPYEQIAIYAQRADVCLGGPFGATLQSQFVITGKTYQFMACGRTTVVGLNEETGRAPFVDKVNCLLVNQASSTDISRALRWCLKNTEELYGIGERASRTYIHELSINSAARHLLCDVYTCLQVDEN